MKKYLIVVLLAFLSVACSSDEEKWHGVQIVITRTSNNFSYFESKATITAFLEKKKGFGVRASDYDSSLSYGDDKYSVLVKIYDDYEDEYYKNKTEDVAELRFQQEGIDFEIEDNPKLKDNLTEEQLKDAMLETKIEIFIDNKLVKTENFTFDVNGLNSYKMVFGD